LTTSPLQSSLLTWLDTRAEMAVYAITHGRLAYGNQSFDAQMRDDATLLAEFIARPRSLPAHVPPVAGKAADATPVALPAQTLRDGTHADASDRIEAQEWLVPTCDGPIVIGCFRTQATSSANHALLRVALHDALTDLPNRSLLEDRLFQAIARSRRNRKLAALLYLDLDQFKPVNDRYGHQAGDIVLQTVAGRMLACVRETDTVARLGGDEFAIVLDEIDQQEQAEIVAAKLIAAIGEPITLPEGATVNVSCSIGVVLCPTNGVNLISLMQAADQAMYTCKGTGSGRYCLSTAAPPAIEPGNWMEDNEAEMIGVPEIDRQHETLIALANRLHRAIEDSEDYVLQSALLDELVSYTQYHFASEEALMDRYKDPNAEAHKRQHAQLVAQVQFFRHALSNSDSQMILSALRPWLIRHIRSYDRALGAFLMTRKAREPGASPS